MESSDRLLIAVSYGFSVRYLLSTGVLDSLRNVCVPVVGLGWTDDDLVVALAARGIETVRLPDARLNHRYRMYRRRLELVHKRKLNSVTSRIRQRNPFEVEPSTKLRAITRLRLGLDHLRLWFPGGVGAVESAESQMVDSGTNVSEFNDFLGAQRIASVLALAPYHDQEGLLLLAAHRRGLRTITSVISFDNPTTRGRWLQRSDLILVWNEFNAKELLRSYRELSMDQISIIGAPQFDLHRRPHLIMDEDDWRSHLGIDPDRALILYGASPQLLVPGEFGLVELLDRAISDGRIPGSPLIIVRGHPNDPADTWHELTAQLSNAISVDSWSSRSSSFHGWPTEEDIIMQMSCLAHCNVHVNIGSSMTLDGAMFDRAQIGPAFVPGAPAGIQRRVQTFYDQEHLCPVVTSGGISIASDERALVAAIKADLEDPSRLSSARERMIKLVLTADDGLASKRLVDEIARF